MRFASILRAGKPTLAVRSGDQYVDLALAAPELPPSLRGLLERGPIAPAEIERAIAAAPAAARVDAATAQLLPPIADAQKYICLGLNYVDHASESPYDKPAYPVLFARYPTSFVGSGAALATSDHSTQFDYEGELVAVIGTAARNVSESDALEHVAGYSIFNDGSYRDYQFKTHQWMVGKNFDRSGSFGPEFVSADELPPGAHGLRLQTLLNGTVMQDASTADMIFGVATTIATISEVITLVPGDVLVMGTPAGVGFARKPPVWLKSGDRVDVVIEQIGTLSNPVAAGA